MDSSIPLHSFPQLKNNDHFSFLESTPNNYLTPDKFIWPKEKTLFEPIDQDLNEPVVDLEGFYRGDEESILQITDLVRSACLSHGLFQVINHGVDQKLISSMNDRVKDFFKLPLDEKLRLQRFPGSICGYSLAHADRFSAKLPWKEIISFCYSQEKGPDSDALVFFKSAFGEEFESNGWPFQEYCSAMTRLSCTIMDILGMSLGVHPSSYFKDFFQEGSSIMRCNFYPPCQEPGLTLGTGPHCDPTALTILHQDQVGGLQVFFDDKWMSVMPRKDALVISVGDTFTALSNGVYKSCSHRAVVNRWMERISMAFFLCPKDDKLIVPPENLVSLDRPRNYPDFTWSDLFAFTQKHYRADVSTLHNFTQWIISTTSTTTKNPSKPAP